MRVLHIVEATIAGVRTHVETLASGLKQRGFRPEVACPLRRQNSYGDDRFVNYLTNAGIPIWPVAMQRSIDPRADAAALRRLVAILGRERFDIIHLHSSKAGLLGRLAARASRSTAAVVYSPHGLAFLGAGSAARRQLYLRIEQLAGPLCDRIIAVSEGERALALRAGLAGAERIVCIPNGIVAAARPTPAERAAARAGLGLPAGVPLIGTAARLSAQKNPQLFLDAAAQLLLQRPEARFVWCGGGELAGAARDGAERRGIAHACHFVGHRDDARRIIAAYDIFWLTSDYEGLPLAPLEAMALGVPIVATDVLGTRDLLRSGAGLLAPAGDAAALAGATARLLRMPERRAQLAQAGYVYFQQHGTAEQMLGAMQQLYTQLVATRGHRIAMPARAGQVAQAMELSANGGTSAGRFSGASL